MCIFRERKHAPKPHFSPDPVAVVTLQGVYVDAHQAPPIATQRTFILPKHSACTIRFTSRAAHAFTLTSHRGLRNARTPSHCFFFWCIACTRSVHVCDFVLFVPNFVPNFVFYTNSSVHGSYRGPGIRSKCVSRVLSPTNKSCLRFWFAF